MKQRMRPKYVEKGKGKELVAAWILSPASRGKGGPAIFTQRLRELNCRKVGAGGLEMDRWNLGPAPLGGVGFTDSSGHNN